MKCARCEHENQPHARFCSECGGRLTTTPRHLAQKILTSRDALAGERKQITVLFADMKGSMELLADRDPEDARQILDPVLDLMIEAVHRYEGTVNQVMGDGIMALFGAPVAHEDHAMRGCYAAVHMQEVVRRYSDEMSRTGRMPIQLRIGLNSGEVVVRSIGSHFRMDYSAIGQTTHLAARMEQLATPGSILVTQETVKLAGPAIRVRALGPVAVKGLDAPVETYELQDIAPTYPGLVAVRNLTRFVGRNAELECLRRALEGAGAAYGQVIGVIGDPGVGKTRLFHEFTRSPFTRGWLVLSTTALSYGRTTPYLPVVHLLRSYFKLDEHHSRAAMSQTISDRVLSADPAMRPALPALLALLDVPVDDPAWEALDPQQRRERTLDALRHLLLRESQLQPVCLVVENLHWIDGETEAFLDRLVDGLPSHRLLLLLSYRPEYRHQWGVKTYYSQFRIEPLDHDSVEEIIRDLLGSAPDVDALKTLLVEKTEGNPFFLEECLRALVETRMLVGQPGAYRLAAPVRSIRVPATVQAVLAARIDRLPNEEKELLQSAAVIGKTVPLTIVQELAGLPDDVIYERLQRLQTAEFMYETRSVPHPEYTFKHALTHEVAYGSLLNDRRRAMHADIVEVMEARHGDTSREYIEQLAHHAFHGEVWDKAVTYLHEAGVKAFAQAAHREAAERLTRALTALERLPATRATIEQAVDLRLALRNTLLPVGEVATVLRHLRDAEILAASLDDQRRAGWISGYLGACFWSLGDYAEALEAARRAYRSAVALDDRALRIYATTALTWPYHSLGQYRAGIASAVEAIQVLEASPDLERLDIPSRPAVLARTWLVSCLAEIGEFARAVPLAQEAVRLAEGSGEPWSLVDAYLGVGILHVRRGDIPSATTILAKGLDISRRFHIDVWFPPLASSLGHTLAVSNLPEALTLLERAVLQASTTGLRFYHSLSVLWLAEAYALGHRVADARRRAFEALELCERYHEAGNRAHTLRVLGEIAAREGSFETAEQWYRQAQKLGTDLEMRPLVGQCHLGLGELAWRQHRWTAARTDLAAALRLFGDLEMKNGTERALATLQAVQQAAPTSS